MVSLTISSILVVLVSTVFLAQNRYYATQVQRGGAHDVARAVTEIVGAEIRGVPAGGFVAARSDSLTVRSPMAILGICATQGNFAYAYYQGGEDALDTEEIAGVAVQDPATGAWSFYNARWQGGLDGGTAQAMDRCAANGADTVGVSDDWFLRIRRLNSLHGFVPPVGTLLMLFRQTTFVLGESGLQPGTRALYRAAHGDTVVEFATGMDSTAQFRYRRFGSSAFDPQQTGGNLARIDAVRIVARARQRSDAGGVEDLTFGWSVDIPLRNVR